MTPQELCRRIDAVLADLAGDTGPARSLFFELANARLTAARGRAGLADERDRAALAGRLHSALQDQADLADRLATAVRDLVACRDNLRSAEQELARLRPPPAPPAATPMPRRSSSLTV
jgi:hypothetical protein